MEIKSTMSGTIIEILVKVGDEVKVDQELFLLESMKMEMPIQSESKGKVSKINVKEEDFVQEGQALLELDS